MWKAIRLWLFGQPFVQPEVFPPVTQWMKQKGLTWARVGDTEDFVMVCDFCSGNCGQCGLTEIVGCPGFDVGRMAHQAGIAEEYERRWVR